MESCGDTQGLVRTFVPPGSIECNFMSQLTSRLTDPALRMEKYNHDARAGFGAAVQPAGSTIDVHEISTRESRDSREKAQKAQKEPDQRELLMSADS